MGRMTLETRRRVIKFSWLGMQLKAIQRHLAEGVTISKTSLCLLLKKYKETGTIADQIRPRSLGRKLQLEHLRLIDEALDKDGEISSVDLHKCYKRKLEFSFPSAQFNVLKITVVSS